MSKIEKGDSLLNLKTKKIWIIAYIYRGNKALRIERIDGESKIIESKDLTNYQLFKL